MKLKPLGDRVVVEREEAKSTTAGGIVLPDTAKDKPQKGKVMAIGDGRITKDGTRRPLHAMPPRRRRTTRVSMDSAPLVGRRPQ